MDHAEELYDLSSIRKTSSVRVAEADIGGGGGGVAIIFRGILVVGKVLAGCIGSAPYVQVATRVMSTMLCLNAQGCKIFVTNIQDCLESMQLPCFNSCGKMIFVVLQYLSRSA